MSESGERRGECPQKEGVERAPSSELKALANFFGFKNVDYFEMPKYTHDVGEYSIPLTTRLNTIKRLGIAEEEYTLVEAKFLNFLFVAKYGRFVRPSEDVRVLWMSLIEDTRAYLDFCKCYMGFFFHHHVYVHEYRKEFDVEIQVALEEVQKEYPEAMNGHRSIMENRFSVAVNAIFTRPVSNEAKRTLVNMVESRRKTGGRI